ncbi:phosphonate C-P lyase system protein PhnH [Rhizobiales bacterium]|uniref:phosphonate C-P lyase system protein PhnH n=1 Tax=Hongsoonwoonella zoysiae TaxID=2821844 RepID=UPI0015614B6F|nr:phosphonate C-P lyase system protein PhnH [Hongsoonwoonella zoysiae]NRG16952.1 phosphonate C-P lyase system protein PhnH [Hongsoonwoonella zoysiae]
MSALLEAAAPLPGLPDPVHDSQATFRTVMNALARPGQPQKLDTGDFKAPAPLSNTAAAIALSLVDYDTPVWLDSALAGSSEVRQFLRFHTGCPITADRGEASFALISDAERMPPLASFNQGTLEYPDRSTTIIAMVDRLTGPKAVTLSGPGLKTPAGFGANPLPLSFWAELATIHAQFPRGVDMLFVTKKQVAGLPRSTRIETKDR